MGRSRGDLVLSSRGAALLELAIITPLLMLMVAAMLHSSLLIFNIGRLTDAAFEGATYAPTGATNAEVKDRVETLLQNSCMNCANILATITTGGNRVTVQADADYQLNFFRFLGVVSIPISITQVGYHPAP